jgi:hypothetical protein
MIEIFTEDKDFFNIKSIYQSTCLGAEPRGMLFSCGAGFGFNPFATNKNLSIKIGAKE